MGAEWWYLFDFFILIVLSGFFSGSESALFSISETDFRKLQENTEGVKSSARIIRLLQKPGRLLNAILIGNTLVNVAAATVAALYIAGILHGEVSEITLFNSLGITSVSLSSWITLLTI